MAEVKRRIHEDAEISLYNALKHGDDAHRNWLLAAIRAWARYEPPPVRAGEEK